MPEQKTKKLLEELLNSQVTGVIATEKDHQPYANLVAFSFTENLKKIYFATPMSTTKYRNLANNPHISLLIDTRKNNREDFTDSTAITVLGICKGLSGTIKDEILEIHSLRLPGLREFLKNEMIAMMEIKVNKYIITNGLAATTEFVP
jgi:hypothetical protein